MGETSQITPETATALVNALAQVLKQQTQQPDDWQVVSEPMKKPLDETDRKELEKFVLLPTTTPDMNGKHLEGFETGTFLDTIFLDETQRTLKGIPVCSQIGMTGLSGSGKSILVEEIAVKSASKGKRVCYVTGEDVFASDSPRLDLQSRLIQKAKLLGLDWDTIRQNIIVLDAVKFPELREWKTFAEAYRYVCEKYKISLSLIDSITVLETSRFHLKYRVIELVRYNQLHGITAIFVNQRGEEKDDISGMSGGYNLDYQYDITVIIDFCRTTSWTPKQMLEDLGAEKGEFVRYARVLDSRLCGFKRNYRRFDITDNGFVNA